MPSSSNWILKILRTAPEVLISAVLGIGSSTFRHRISGTGLERQDRKTQDPQCLKKAAWHLLLSICIIYFMKRYNTYFASMHANEKHKYTYFPRAKHSKVTFWPIMVYMSLNWTTISAGYGFVVPNLKRRENIDTHNILFINFFLF